MPLHIISIPVTGHGGLWGKRLSRDFTLPSKVHRLRGVVANVTVGEGVEFARHKVFESNSQSYTLGAVISPLVGSFSLAVNGTGVAFADVQVNALSVFDHCSTFNQSLFSLQSPVTLPSGVSVRVSFAERLECPFVDTTDEAELTKYGLAAASLDYTIKIYIDYD